MNEYMKELQAKIASAARFEHPDRLMRITLECAHMRLMPFQDALGGIGWSTNCKICNVSRLIVNQEETGVL
jgi:hypothetical protein